MRYTGRKKDNILFQSHPKMRYLTLLGSALLCISAALAKSSTGSSVLVVFDPKLEKEHYSLFFSGLEGMRILCLRENWFEIVLCVYDRERIRTHISRSQGR